MTDDKGRFGEPEPKKRRVLVKTDSVFDLDIDFLAAYEDKDDLADLFSTTKLKEWHDSSGQRSQMTEQDVQNYDKLITQFPVTTKAYRLLPKADRELSHFFPQFLDFNKTIINSKPRVVVDTMQKLGQGAYGAVYRGTWTVDGTTVSAAFKSAISHETDDFDQELDILQQLDHVAVVRFLGSCIKESKRYITMELCEGNLDQYVRGQLDIAKDTSTDRLILGQVALGLGYLHGRDPPIIHKDLKPQNILLQRRSGLVLGKLTDFGFSRQRPLNQDQFDPTRRPGTDGFISPELLNTAIPSLESDVWAYGATVFYVVSGGQYPHEIPGLGDMNKLIRSAIVIKFKTAPNMAAISDHLPAADLTYRLLCYEPKQRPSIFLVLHHPYFSLAQNRTYEYLSKKLNDFLTVKRPDGGRYLNRQLFTFDKLQKWYDDLDKTDETDEEREQNERFVSKLGEHVPGACQYSPNNLLTLIKESMKDRVNTQAKIDLLVLRRSQDLNLLDLSSNALLVSFIWSTLISLDLSREQYRDHLQMSELEFGLIHQRPEFFEEIWNLRSGQLDGTKVDNLLSTAAALNLPEFVRKLVRKGANPNFIDRNGYTALFHAATHEPPDLRVIQLLLDYGADPNIPDRHGTTLLRHMHVVYYPDVVKLLLDSGADPNAGPQGWTPLANLIRISSSKCIPIIKLLLDRGASPSVLDHKGVPMLSLIIERGEGELLQLLVDKGASISYVDDRGRTFLHHVMLCQKLESIAPMARTLLGEGINTNEADLEGRTALHYAASRSLQMDIMKMLIDHGADTRLVDRVGKTPRDCLNRGGDASTVLKLLTKS